MWKRKTKSLGGSGKNHKDVVRAVEALRRGDVIVFPTETLYGLGADALNPAAVARVVDVKGRDTGSPISVLVADQSMLNTVVAEIPEIAQRWIDKFWPGPLTLVLKAQRGLPSPLLNPDGGVGVRISSHPLAAEILQALGRPVTATSANPSGKEPARSIEQAKVYFSDVLETFLNGGNLSGKIGSTVIQIDGVRWKILREGEISVKALEESLA